MTFKPNYVESQKFVYSILFGLGITHFMTSAIRFWYDISGKSEISFSGDFISKAVGINITDSLVIYACIEIYFFFNYFRFLFGLLKFSDMLGNDFAPKEEDWEHKPYISNLLRLLVIRIGIVQLLLFSFISFAISRNLPNQFIKSYHNNVSFIANLQSAFLCFFIIDTIIIGLDILSLKGYERFDKSATPEEKKISKNWNKYAMVEISCNVFAIYIAANYHDYQTDKYIMIAKILLVAREVFRIDDFFKRVSKRRTHKPKTVIAED